VLLVQGFHKCSVEYDIYVRETNQKLLIVCLYIDDLIVTEDEEAEIEEFKENMKVVFENTDLRIIDYFLGLEVVHTQSGILLHQKKYILEVLKKFNMADCIPMPTPVIANLKLTEALEEAVVDASLYKQLFGSLIYVCNSRPGISYGVGLVSIFMTIPRAPHLLAAKHILRYLRGTIELALYYPKKKKNRFMGRVLKGWSDSDWCGDKVERKSTYGYLFKYMNVPVSWCSKKQNVVALSSCEVEYIASVEAACQCLWLESVLEELKLNYRKPVSVAGR